MVLLQELYETTLVALQQARNERLWFKTNTKLGMLNVNHLWPLKLFNLIEEAEHNKVYQHAYLHLGKLYFDLREFCQLQKVIKELHAACKNQDGTDDQKKGK